jgi:hypothetical protein
MSAEIIIAQSRMLYNSGSYITKYLSEYLKRYISRFWYNPVIQMIWEILKPATSFYTRIALRVGTEWRWSVYSYTSRPMCALHVSFILIWDGHSNQTGLSDMLTGKLSRSLHLLLTSSYSYLMMERCCCDAMLEAISRVLRFPFDTWEFNSNEIPPCQCSAYCAWSQVIIMEGLCLQSFSVYPLKYHAEQTTAHIR